MECPLESGLASELAVGYRAQTLDPRTSTAYELHLRGCANCRQLSEAQQAVWSALDVWEPHRISLDFDRRLYERIAEDQRLRWWQRIRLALSWRPAVPVAAACAALLAAYLLKTPPSLPATDSRQSKFQIEQVEHALDDMDLLEQIGVESAPAAPHSRARI